MVYRPIRMAPENHVPHPAPEAEEVYRRWLQFLDDEFIRHGSPERRAEIVRDQLYQLYLGRPHGGKLNLTLTSELPGNVVSLSLDPENVTLESEHFADADPKKFAMRKPLLWFWQMFDRSPDRDQPLARHPFSLHVGPSHLSITWAPGSKSTTASISLTATTSPSATASPSASAHC